jgi:ribonuclease D
MHACGNDVRFLKRDYGFEFNNIFDTHKAASLLGSPSLSLPSVIQEYLGIEVKKTKKIQRSRWDIRPLSREQLVYAVQDTSCLIDLYGVMAKRLEEEGLTARAGKAFSKLASSLWTEKTFDPEGYLNIKGCETLNPLEMKRLKALHLWRFEKAKEMNMARFMILSHRNMIDLSKENVSSIDALKEIDTIPYRSIREFGAEIITMLRALS